MKRATGLDGTFGEKYNDVSKLPLNAANSNLQPQPFMTVVELFGLIKEKKAQGITPTVSLDMKDESKNAEAFAKWVGELIKQYGFQDHVFASSFFPDNIAPLKAAYTDAERTLLKKVDWIELDPPQMNQYLQMKDKK